MWSQPLIKESYAIIIDDGLHEFDANITFLLIVGIHESLEQVGKTCLHKAHILNYNYRVFERLASSKCD